LGDKIQVVLGDSSLTLGPISGGSSATTTVLATISQAAENAVNAGLQVATPIAKSPFPGVINSNLVDYMVPLNAQLLHRRT
jgi:xanthine dehydrogenase YagR molybdenum-binding subunit